MTLGNSVNDSDQAKVVIPCALQHEVLLRRHRVRFQHTRLPSSGRGACGARSRCLQRAAKARCAANGMTISS
jgi:hypothetical protein